jgi:hypothetical protein
MRFRFIKAKAVKHWMNKANPSDAAALLPKFYQNGHSR